MNEKALLLLDITGAIDSILESLELNDQARQALAHGNLLLTKLMGMLRPIRIKEPEPGGPRTFVAAERLGLPLEKVRLLKVSVSRGIKEIEGGHTSRAREIFTTARDSWNQRTESRLQKR